MRTLQTCRNLASDKGPVQFGPIEFVIQAAGARGQESGAEGMRRRACLPSFFGIIDLLAILPFYLSVSATPLSPWERVRVRGL